MSKNTDVQERSGFKVGSRVVTPVDGAGEIIKLGRGADDRATIRLDGASEHGNKIAAFPISDLIPERNSGAEETEEAIERDYTIKEATLKEDVCNYGYEVTDGPNHGDFHAVKGSGLVDDDLRQAFGRLHVHMAALDSAFALSGIDVENIDDYHSHELAFRYLTTSFKVNGVGESVTLRGNKYSPASGARIELTVPKIALDNLSSYPFAQPLKTAVDALREEVALYKEGKYTAVEQEEKGGGKQLTIGDALEQAKDDGQDGDLEDGRV